MVYGNKNRLIHCDLRKDESFSALEEELNITLRNKIVQVFHSDVDDWVDINKPSDIPLTDADTNIIKQKIVNEKQHQHTSTPTKGHENIVKNYDLSHDLSLCLATVHLLLQVETLA